MQTESRQISCGMLFQLRDELDRWLGAVRGGNGTWVPATDMYEEDGDLHLEIELPGVEASDVEILTEGQELTIRALSSDPRCPKGAEMLERRRGTYERTLSLPYGWDATRAKADFHNGILTLRVPQAVEPEKARRITLGGGIGITTGQNQNRSFGPAPLGIPEKSAPQVEKVNANGAPKPEPAVAAIVGGPINEAKS
jgi:HSP20 family protein